jgi:hypothetical protein
MAHPPASAALALAPRCTFTGTFTDRRFRPAPPAPAPVSRLSAHRRSRRVPHAIHAIHANHATAAAAVAAVGSSPAPTPLSFEQVLRTNSRTTELAHALWRAVIKEGDTAIDATMGRADLLGTLGSLLPFIRLCSCEG